MATKAYTRVKNVFDQLKDVIDNSEDLLFDMEENERDSLYDLEIVTDFDLLP